MKKNASSQLTDIQAFGTLLNDLSKAFNNNKILISKSNAHEFSPKALKLMNNYLS